jgi:capsular polysaccharide biosynthesis protein
MGLGLPVDGPGGRSAPDAAPGDQPIDLGHVREAVRRSGLFVAVAVLAVMGVVYYLSLRAPERYEATARIAGGGSAVAAGDPSAVATSLATNRELATAPAVLQAVSRTVPGTSAATLANAVSASVERDASILDVTATSSNPGRAAAIANAVATEFLARRTADQRRAAHRARTQLQAQLKGVRETTKAGTQTAAGNLATAIRERISDLALQEVTAGNDLRLAESATPPAAPSAPRPVRSAALAGLAALLLAITVAVVYSRTRRRGAQAQELAERAGIPLLAVLPEGGRLPRRSGRRQNERLVVEQAALQGSVRHALPPKSQRTLLVCDIAGGEGAARVAEGLARSLTWARLDATVLRPGASADPDAELEQARRAGHRYVIVVGPAVTGSSLLPLLACQANAAILVGRLGRTSAGEVATAMQLLSALDLHVLGLVLTASSADAAQLRERGFEAAAPPPPAQRRGGVRQIAG